MPSSVLEPVELSAAERSQLESWTRRRTSAQALALRSRIVLLVQQHRDRAARGPRLQALWHLQPLRRAGHHHRQGHRRAAQPPGSPAKTAYSLRRSDAGASDSPTTRPMLVRSRCARHRHAGARTRAKRARGVLLSAQSSEPWAMARSSWPTQTGSARREVSIIASGTRPRSGSRRSAGSRRAGAAQRRAGASPRDDRGTWTDHHHHPRASHTRRADRRALHPGAT
jgi:hypothetical protein